ncbi:Beta-actin [Madurella fahalii]|uniref:Beta-actin n=1 Tax=Madurella fahalii TaxID=1157608 RepID=A0ABQ0GEH4_9PEZI
MDGEVTPIVIDNGSGTTKAGLAGHDAPQAVFPSIVGWDHSRSPYVGEKAQSQRGVLSMRQPVERGLITDWDAMEEIWRHSYNELQISPEEHPLLLTEGPLNPEKNREKTFQIVFEKFKVPCSYLAMQAVLSLYATGRTTGLLLDSGHSATHAVPVYEGYAHRHGIIGLGFAGAESTSYLARTLARRGYTFSTDEHKIICGIKENVCYVALDIDEAIKSVSQGSNSRDFYQLPDGRVIDVSKERFLTPEVLFQPSIIGVNSYGIHEAISDSIPKCDRDIQRDLWGNVVMSGGNTLYPGICDRVLRELSALAPRDMKIKIVGNPERKYQAWIGGSIVASLSTFGNIWVSKEDYDESGPSVVQRKCF